MSVMRRSEGTGTVVRRWSIALIAALFLRPVAGMASSPAPATPIVNTAFVQYTDANGNALSVARHTISAELGAGPRLHLEKTADSNPVTAGAVLTYTLRYENTGNAAATGVTMVDALPAGVTFQSASAGGVHASADHTVTWDIGTLAVGAGGTTTVAVQVGAERAEGTPIVNTASIDAAEAAPESTTVTTMVGAGSNLILTKIADQTAVLPGGTIAYTLLYHNVGNRDALQVRIVDQVPANTAYIGGSATPAAVLDGDVLTWALDMVPAGAAGAVGFEVRVATYAQSDEGTAIANLATVLSTTQAVASNTVFSMVLRGAVVRLTMDAPEPVHAGSAAVYAIQVTNAGNTPLTGVVLHDPLPTGTTFVSADSGGACAPGGRGVDWAIGTLAVGEVETVTLVVQLDPALGQGSRIENVATVTSNEAPPQQVRAVSGVNARTVGVVGFFDGAWQPAYGYNSGDSLYLEVRDGDQNGDPMVAESVTVVLADLQTGDSETIALAETGPNTGIFRCGARGVPTILGAATAEDGILSVGANSRIRVTYTDPLDVSPVSTARALIDPSGIVFDSVTGSPVAGVVVTICTWNSVSSTCDLTNLPVLPPGQVNPAPPTGADGKFAFPLVPPGSFCFHVSTSAGYVFPSVVDAAALPAGYAIGSGSRGEGFTVSVGEPALILDIPVDPPTGGLVIAKAANKTVATIGDLLGYSLKLSNEGPAPVGAMTISDVMPHGVQYLPGSSLLDGRKLADPEAKAGRTLQWSVSDLAQGKSLELTYRAVVGPDGPRGYGVNTAAASGVSLGTMVVSNVASVKVKITSGLLAENGTILGRIFVDRDGNRIQNQGGGRSGLEPDEPGIPNVALYLEDGTRVITDARGKFSILGVPPGLHVLRVDETSLPHGLVLAPLSNRFMGDGASQFVDLQPGGLFQADFAGQQRRPDEEQTPPATGRADSVTSGGSSPHSPGELLPAGGGAPPVPRLTEAPDWEQAIKSMSDGLEFLSPLDGTAVTRERIRVVLKGPLGTEPSLSINGAPVDAKQIGRRIAYDKGKVTIWEYIDVHLKAGGASTLAVEVKDAFGISRGTTRMTVSVAGAPERLVIRTDRAAVPADGQSLIAVDLSCRDLQDRIVPYTGLATVSISAGAIVESGAGPAGDLQIALMEGAGRFTVRAPRETGEAVITATIDGCQDTAQVVFSPNLRSLLLVGLGDLMVGRGRGRGAYGFLKRDSWFDDGLYSGGRGALFMKGRIYKDVLLTAAYDSDKKRQEELFRANAMTLDAEDKYPVYGDESTTGYEAVSSDRLYLKVEKNRSSLLYGDYRTSLDDTRLAAYNRSFNGLKGEVNTPRFGLRAFGNYTDQTQRMDVLPGKGIAGYYDLTQRPVMEGSERVVVEVRDRYRPDDVLSREPMRRFADYEINYDIGAVLFKEPIPSHDRDYNPIYVVVTYECRTAGARYYTYGGRGAFKPGRWLTLGATGVVEEKALGRYQLSGADLTVALPRSTVLRAECDETHALFDEDSTFTWRSDRAWSVGLESAPLKQARVAGYYRKLGDHFLNVSAVDASRGTTKYGADATYELRPGSRVRSQFIDERDDLNQVTHRRGSVAVQSKFGGTSLTGEVSHEASSGNYVSLAGTTRSPFEINLETPQELTAARVAVETELRRGLSVTLSHKQDLSREGYRLSQAGVNYRLDRLNRLYLREEYQDGLAREEMRTLIGVETQLVRNTVAFDEYRLADGAGGARNQNVMGLRNKFLLGKCVAGDASAEYLKTVSGAPQSREPDAGAAALSLSYLAKERLKITSRFEHRRELVVGGRASHLGELGVACKLGPDYSFLLRERYFTEVAGAGGRQTSSRAMMGLAYRPLSTSRFNALSKVEYKQESNAAAAPSRSEEAWLCSNEGAWRATSQLQITGKYAGKLVRDNSLSAYTDMVAGRLSLGLTDRWDLGAEYRVLNSHVGNNQLQGGTVESGYRVVKNLWCSTGYSFDRFDADLIGDGYRGEGPYLRIRVKFDESALDRLARR
jgi:uncharacterized repeat protein (TIGR01451 family)